MTFESTTRVPGAITALRAALVCRAGGDGREWLLLALAYARHGDRPQARTWYDRAVQWMDKNQPNDEDLRRFRAEAAELLKIADEPTTKPKSK